ncbi:hypothetical protein BKA64DRAFT_640146 [Cadophora sp. MPI-SDFR-AT-0126]|nr:hypothetical protein BKA64DRAFT_640146 [Leotiomycetes sp. MPI-SDFR-AT-0126]
MGNIHLRDSLWPKELRDLERQQFNDLDSEDEKAYNKAYRRIKKMNEENNARAKKIFKIGTMSFDDVEGLIVTFPPLAHDTITQYMESICQYMNLKRRDHKVRKLRSGKVLGIPRPPTPARGYRTRRKAAPVPTMPDFPSCIFISTADFETMNHDNKTRTDAIDLLQNMECVGDKFRNLDYLFVPYHNEYLGEHGHYCLLGIAPKQKYIFAIDGAIQTDYDIGTWPMSGIWDILVSQQRRAERAITFSHYTDNGQEEKERRLTGARTALGKATYTNVGNEGEQCHAWNTMNMNSTSLAVASDPRFDSANIPKLNPNKRPRMFSELANGTRDGDNIKTGFEGKFAYDLLDIPSMPLYNTRTGRPKEVQEQSEGEQSEEGTSDEDDLDEQRGMVDDEKESREDTDIEIYEHMKEVKAFSNEISVVVEGAIVADFMHHLPPRGRMEPNTRIFYPSTISFGYKSEPELGTSPEGRSMSFAYRKIQNQIAACVETFWAGDVQPFDSIIDGFEKWIENNPRIGIYELELELGRWEIGLGESKPATDISSRSLFVEHVRMRMRDRFKLEGSCI